MKRIIYNTKLKKIVIVLLLVMLLFPKILPYKVWAANCTAEELRTELNKYYEITGKSVSVNECQNIINKIVSGQGSITIENGTIKIKAPEDTIKEAFESASGGPYSDGVVDTIISNGWDWMGVQTISKESTSSKEENKETPNESNKGSNSSVAQDLQNILNSNSETLGKYNITLKQCQDIINYIENSHSRNSVTSKNNGKTININAVSSQTVREAFVNKGGYELYIAELIANNDYSYFSVTLVDPNDIPEGEEDNRTEVEIIRDILLSKYQESITPEQLNAIIDAGKYTVAKDENGKIIDADLNLTWDEMDSFGISDQGKTQINDAQKKDTDYADLGGILLSPVFYLINFIADAVISITGSIMDPDNALDFGLGVLTNTKPTTTYSQTTTYDADVTSFIPTNLSGLLFNNGSISYQYPHLTYTPEEIFSGKIDLLSIDFITGTNYEGEQNENEGWLNIRKVISQWYQILRMIAIIGLLSVLIYTGIKIIISANAKDKAKYKEWIMNWLMAVAILFFMHIIMAFIVAITGEFSKLMNEAFQGIHVVPSDNSANAFDTNLMGLVRFMIQSENFFIKVGFEVMYIALIWYTLKFTFLYLKRVLNMAFLTLIAPIVALTYPIDKLNDGSAQGFDMWLKEYIFNALLQPMHCVLYYVLVGSAVGIAADNPIYGIVVLAFMSEAEKLLKQIFGFKKAGATSTTNGGMVSAFTAGAIASNIGKIAKLAGGGGGKGNSNNAESESDIYNKPKAIDTSSGDELFGVDAPEADTSSSQNNANDVNNENDDEANFYRQQRQDRLDMNMSEEEVDAEMMASYGTTGRSDTQSSADSQQGSGSQSSSNPEPSSNTGGSPDDGTPVRKKNFAKGAKAVGKKLLKPYWDLEHGGAYNRKRLARKIGRAALGAGLGIGAAAVQAGISITDGKYSMKEGALAFAAGYAGGGQIAKGFGGLIDTYKEGTLPDDPKERKKEIMRRAQERFADREDVIKHNKKYAKEDRKNIVEIQKELLAQGITDLKEMDSCIKYIKQANGGTLEGADSNKNLIKKSRVMHDFADDSYVQKVRFDPDKRQKYIDSVAKDANEAKILKRKFSELEVYMDANKN